MLALSCMGVGLSSMVTEKKCLSSTGVDLISMGVGLSSMGVCLSSMGVGLSSMGVGLSSMGVVNEKKISMLLKEHWQSFNLSYDTINSEYV